MKNVLITLPALCAVFAISVTPTQAQPVTHQAPTHSHIPTAQQAYQAGALQTYQAPQQQAYQAPQQVPLQQYQNPNPQQYQNPNPQQYQNPNQQQYQNPNQQQYQNPNPQQYQNPNLPQHQNSPVPVPGAQQSAAPVLDKAALRDIDRLVVQLSGYSRELHDEFHQHFESERHAVKLDEEVTALEKMADDLHRFATTADGSAQSIARMRNDTNEFIQYSIRIARTIDLTEPWLRGNNIHTGMNHLRTVARSILSTALQIDGYLPVDIHVIDSQAERLEAAVKELHDEFHEHLEGYEVSQHLDEDLEEIETLVEHMHDLAHNRSWQQIDFSHLMRDISDVKQKTAHIESLFVRQAGIGVRSSDWIGIEHSRDAITDVLSSAYLLEHMVRKTGAIPQIQQRQPTPVDNRPMRDRHGHPIQPRN